MPGLRGSNLRPVAALTLLALGCSTGAPGVRPTTDGAGTDLAPEAKADLVASDSGTLDGAPSEPDTGAQTDVQDAPGMDTDSADAVSTVDVRSDADGGRADGPLDTPLADRGPERMDPPPCPSGQHDGGDGRCVTTGTCAVGFTHDALGACARWTLGRPMPIRRAAHTATVLPDGRIVVFGGYQLRDPGRDVTDSVGIYDSVTDTWTDGGRLNFSRAFHTATLLLDGRILVAGGVVGPTVFSEALREAEIYDLTTRRSTLAGMMPNPRRDFQATRLFDGRVLVSGGYDPVADRFLSSCALFDPRDRTWTPTGSMMLQRARHTATLLLDGTVLVAGGLPTVRTELYDPMTGRWSNAGNLLENNERMSATLVDDGTVWITGGRFARDDLEGQYYDPVDHVWHFTVPPIRRRYDQNSVLLFGNRILLAAGTVADTTSIPSATAAYVSVNDRRMIALPALSYPRFFHTTSSLPDGRAVVIGGNGTQPLDSVEVLQLGR